MGPDGRQRAAQGLSGHHGEVRLIIGDDVVGPILRDSAVARTTPTPPHRARRLLASDDASHISVTERWIDGAQSLLQG
jgi:hypothetical protein